jgi:hypothetical protein
MGTPILNRQSQILMKVETTSGTAESLTSSNGGQRVHVTPEVSPDIPMEEQPIARNTMSALDDIPTTQALGISYRTAMNTPDIITANDLEHKPALRASGLTIEDLEGTGIGAISSGPFTRGETVEDVSGNTARVLKETATGESWLYTDPISGNLQTGEVLTGSSSGATTTASSTSANHGYIAKPTSDNQETVTIRKEMDGEQWTAAGAMSKFVFTAENSKPMYFDFAFMGPYYSHGAQSMTTGITYQTELPPKFQGAEFKIDSVSTLVVKSVSFDDNSEPVKREDANTATTGIISAYKATRGNGPKLTVSIELPASGTLDLLGSLRTGTTHAINFKVGTAKGKTGMFFVDRGQVESVSYGDSDGIATIDVVFACKGAANSGDDEFEMIWF